MDKFKYLKPLHSDLNAYTFSFDESLLEEIRETFLAELSPTLAQKSLQYLFEGGKVFKQPIGSHQSFYIYSYESDPLLWISNNCEWSYQMFLRFFDSLELSEDIKQLVDYKDRIQMYSGFFVVGNRAPKPIWHYDYFEGANAYTLITPLFELHELHGNLKYEIDQKTTSRYQYKSGEAIILGDGFLHSTEPYPISPHMRVLLSVTFGSDNLDHWPVLKKTISTQSSYTMMPCGHLVDTCRCLWQNKIYKLTKKLKSTN